MWLNIDYKYRSALDIQNTIGKYSNFSIVEIIILGVIFIWVICLVMYIIPTIKVYIKMTNKRKDSENKKLALKQIIIQKEMEEEVQKEMEEENLKF